MSDQRRRHRQHYDELCAEADALIRAANPCQIKDGVCAEDLPDGCCLCDEHRPGQPCQRQSLGCKLHFCKLVKDNYPDFMENIESIRQRAERAGFDLEVFSTFDDHHNPTA